MIRSHHVFTFVLIVVLFLLTFYLDQVTSIDTSKKHLDPNVPEYIAENLNATRFDKQGNMQERAKAERMWQFPGQAVRYFMRPELFLYKEGVLAYKLDGSSGYYDHANKKAFFDNKVILNIPPSQEQPASRVETSKAMVDLTAQLVTTDQPVSFQHGASHGTAIGAKYDRRNEQLYLLSKVRITYVQP